MVVTGCYGANQINDATSLPLVPDTGERTVQPTSLFALQEVDEIAC